MFCTNCGKENSETSKNCVYCGEELTASKDEPKINSEPQEIVASQISNEPVSEDFILEEPTSEEIYSNSLDSQELQENMLEEPVIEKEEYKPESENNEGYQEQSEYITPEIEKRYRPISTANFFFTEIILLVPVINIILILIWSFYKKVNVNRKAFARSILIWFLAGNVILLFLLTTLIFLRYPIGLEYWFVQFKFFINSIPTSI